MLRNDIGDSLILICSTLINLHMHIQRIIKQIYLFLSNLCNDIEWLVGLLYQHVDHLAGDFWLVAFWLFRVLADVLEADWVLVHGLVKLHTTIFNNPSLKLINLSGLAPWLFVLTRPDEAILVADIIAGEVVVLVVLRTINYLLLVVFNLDVAFVKMLHENAQTAFFVRSVFYFVY